VFPVRYELNLYIRVLDDNQVFIEALSRYLRGGTTESHRKPQLVRV
jgi:hypothetical protein